MSWVFFLTALFMLGANGHEPKSTSHDNMTPIPEITIGQKNAPIRIEMYYSLGCAHCRDFFSGPDFKKIKNTFLKTGKVLLVLKDLPTDEPSLFALKIARSQHSKYYRQISHHLLHHQDDWHTDKNWKEKLIEVAKKTPLPNNLVLEESVIQDALNNKKLEDDIYREGFNAKKKGVPFAPAFLINGKLFDKEGTKEMTFDEMSKIVGNHPVH